MRRCHLSVENSDLLISCLAEESDPGLRYRLAFLNALQDIEYDLEKVCNIFQVATSTAYVWLRSWNERGYDGLAHPFHASDRSPGRPPALDENALQELKQLLEEHDNWETKEVRQLIHDVWGVDLSDSQVRRILRGKLKMHNSKPYPYDYRRPPDAEEQLEDSLNDAFNRLNEKGFSGDEIAIGFLDEASPQTTANSARVWHTGRAKIIKNTTRYKANAFGFYAIVGNSVIDFPVNSKKESVAHFLETIWDANREHKAIIAILDNFSSHRSEMVQEYARNHNIELVYLFSYAPDLSPIEFIWKSVKRCVSLEFVESLSHIREIILQVWSSAA